MHPPVLIPELNSISNDWLPVLTELSTTADDYTGWRSPDNCRLYLSSIDKQGQHLDVFVATRTP